MVIELETEYAKNILKVLENHESLGYAIVSQDIKDIVSKEAYDKLTELFMKYHNANCGPFNRHLKKLIDKKMTEYKTLEQQIIELWKSRGLDVEIIKVRVEKGNGIWTIIAPVKKIGEK